MTAFIAFMGSLMAVMFVLAMLRIGELTKENQTLRAQLLKKPRAPRTVADKYRKAIESHAVATIENADPLRQPSIDRSLWSVLPIVDVDGAPLRQADA